MNVTFEMATSDGYKLTHGVLPFPNAPFVLHQVNGMWRISHRDTGLKAPTSDRVEFFECQQIAVVLNTIGDWSKIQRDPFGDIMKAIGLTDQMKMLAKTILESM